MPTFVLNAFTTNATIPKIAVKGFADNFNRSDGPLGVTSGEGKAWALAHYSTGTATPITIAGNRAVSGSGGSNWDHATVDGLSADGVLTATVAAVSTRQGGLTARYTDANNTLRVLLRVSSTDLRYAIASVVNGTQSTFATAAAGVTAADGDVLRLEMTGQSLVLKRNGTTIITATSPIVSGTRHGLLAAGPSLAWDDISFVAA